MNYRYVLFLQLIIVMAADKIKLLYNGNSRLQKVNKPRGFDFHVYELSLNILNYRVLGVFYQLERYFLNKPAESGNFLL